MELLIRVQTKPRFTAAELAEEFGVSRRTVLRDLRALSEMGVPLRSTPGPGGGYSLPRGGRRLSPSLTVDEAMTGRVMIWPEGESWQIVPLDAPY
jgi:predicted DNA-binding transcriptional regulator YafY